MARNIYWAVDFDGTLCTNEFPSIGIITSGHSKLHRTLRLAHALGIKIIIWTCRSGDYIPPMTRFLDENCIPYDYINENPEASFSTSPKIFADVYIDDRSLNPFPEEVSLESYIMHKALGV